MMPLVKQKKCNQKIKTKILTPSLSQIYETIVKNRKLSFEKSPARKTCD